MTQGTVNNFWPRGRGSEDFGCVTIKATRPPIRLRSILMNPPLILIGSQFAIVPPFQLCKR